MAESDRFSAGTAAIILAAGKGTRMKSQQPKVLHRVLGTPMLERIIKIMQEAGIQKICLVLSENTKDFDQLFTRYPQLTAVIQHRRLGTGDAVASAACAFQGETVPAYASGTLVRGSPLTCEQVLICAGDTPALDSKILTQFVDQCQQTEATLGVIGMEHPRPTGYGRLIVDERQHLQAIIEEKDADAKTKAIRLCNSGVIYGHRQELFQLLAQLGNDNAQKEYYLTDCFQLAAKAGRPAFVFQSQSYRTFDGVNQRSHLAAIEAWLVQQKIEELMASGVTFRLPASTYIEDEVSVGNDSEIGPHCSLTGHTRIGRNCRIGAHCVLHNVELADTEELPPGTITINP